MKKIVFTLCAIAALSVQAAYAKSDELNPKYWQELNRTQDNLSLTTILSFKPSSLHSVNRNGTIKRGLFMTQIHTRTNKACFGLYSPKSNQLFCNQILDLTIDCQNNRIDFNQARSFGKNNKFLGSHKTIFRGGLGVTAEYSSYYKFHGDPNIDGSEWGYYYRAACSK